MPLPELNLSLSITDNPGSPLYTGHGEREKMASFDSQMKQHTITITISEEQIGEFELPIDNQLWKNDQKIILPTYKMLLTDTLTDEKSIYEVTRDNFLSDEIQKKKVGGISIFGKTFFAKEGISMPMIAFEPDKENIETFTANKQKTLKKNALYYTLSQKQSIAYLVAGVTQNIVFTNPSINYLFYVIQGEKFIGDILYREKFLKLTPIVKINLIKRKSQIKEVVQQNKKIIYLS